MSTNIFGNVHETEKLIPLYNILQTIKNQQPDYLIFKQQGEFYEKFEILQNYLMFNDIDQLLNIICKYNNYQYYESLQAYQYLKAFEYQTEVYQNINKLIENNERRLEQQIENLNKFEQTKYKVLIYGLKLISKKIENEEDYKQINKILKQYTFYLDSIQQSQNCQVLNDNVKLFYLPVYQFILLYGTYQILINSLKYKCYIEFSERNYYYQTQLLPKIFTESNQISQFHSQIWKFQSIMLDITQSLINFTDLFSATQYSFNNEGIQKISFSFNNITRGLKVLKIISEEQIFKYFYEAIELKIQEYKPPENEQNQNKYNFKPQVKIVFHGLDDFNLENPKQAKLDLDIVIQIGENEYFTLNNQSNQVLYWNYEKVKYFKLVLILLNQFIECTDLMMKHIPKNAKEYFEQLCSQINKQKLDVDRITVTNWFQSEKQNISNSIDALSSLLESMEFVLLKTESCINKDLSKYQRDAKPFTINKDRLSKILIQEGQKVEFDILNRIEVRTIDNMKISLESILKHLNPITLKMKSNIQQMKKYTQNFK